MRMTSKFFDIQLQPEPSNKMVSSMTMTVMRPYPASPLYMYLGTKTRATLLSHISPTFIGFRWDLPKRQISLPEEKQLKFHNRVRIFLACFTGHPCSLLDIQKNPWFPLSHCIRLLPGPFAPTFIVKFISTFLGNEFTHCYPPKSMITDLKWWLHALDNPGCFHELLPRGPPQDMGLFVDASTSWGLGIIVAGQWAAFRLHRLT